MKKIISALCCCLIFQLISLAQTDSNGTANQGNNNTNAGTTLTTAAGTTVNVTPTLNPAGASTPQACDCNRAPLDIFQKLIVLLPCLISVIVIMLMMRSLKGSNFTLAEALADSDHVPNSVETTDPTTGVKTVTNANVVVPTKSSSRLVLFLSGIIALILSVCIVTYYLYFYLYCGAAPEMNSLVGVLLSLGIGVVPYSVNKLTS